VVSKSKPSTDQEFVEFSQALYDQIKKKQLEIKQVVNN
jgi:hypothetical protein